MCRWKCNLLDLSEIIFWISIQHHLSYRNQWIVCMWPNFSNVKNVPLIIFCLTFWHHLHIQTPCSGFSWSNVFKKISSCIISVFSFKLVSDIRFKILYSSVCLEVIFNPKSFTFSINPSECVTTKTMHVSETIWSSSIRK